MTNAFVFTYAISNKKNRTRNDDRDKKNTIQRYIFVMDSLLYGHSKCNILNNSCRWISARKPHAHTQANTHTRLYFTLHTLNQQLSQHFEGMVLRTLHNESLDRDIERVLQHCSVCKADIAPLSVLQTNDTALYIHDLNPQTRIGYIYNGVGTTSSKECQTNLK